MKSKEEVGGSGHNRDEDGRMERSGVATDGSRPPTVTGDKIREAAPRKRKGWGGEGLESVFSHLSLLNYMLILFIFCLRSLTNVCNFFKPFSN